MIANEAGELHPSFSVSWCDCGATIGKALVDGKWHWTHSGIVQGAIDLHDGSSVAFHRLGGKAVHDVGTRTWTAR